MEREVPRGEIWGDPGRLRQVLANLVENAIKFSPSGAIVVSVSLMQRSGPYIQVRFEVTDQGIGIAPDTLKRLFAPFTQADNSSTRKYGGMGLGLAIAKALTARMDGDIGAVSAPGEGSTFWFTARLRECPIEAATGDGKFAHHDRNSSTLLL
jgi:hypothetical protein